MSNTKLVLHFDINGTITPYDTTDTGTPEENANMIISKNIYGTMCNDEWKINDDIYDETNSVSYYNYLRHAFPTSYKKLSYVFTNNNNPGEKFNYMVNQIIKSMDELLFDSFLNVMEKMPSALIVFRTFGLDADEIIHYLRTNIKTKHHFEFVIKGSFGYDNDEHSLILENGLKVCGAKNINNLFESSKQHLALKENYNYWNSNSRNKLNGKQLLGSANMTQIFFDDNECVNIVDSTNAHYFKVNTLLAMIDPMYYFDKIKSVCDV